MTAAGRKLAEEHGIYETGMRLNGIYEEMNRDERQSRTDIYKDGWRENFLTKCAKRKYNRKKDYDRIYFKMKVIVLFLFTRKRAKE